jgi:hypothetical protein
MNQQIAETSQVYHALLTKHIMAFRRKVVRALVQRLSVEADRLSRYTLLKVLPEGILGHLLAVRDHAEDLSIYFQLDPSSEPDPGANWFEVAHQSFWEGQRAQKEAMLFMFSRVAFSGELSNYAAVYCGWVCGRVRRHQKGGAEHFEAYGEFGRGELNELQWGDQGWTISGEHLLWQS